MNSTANAKLEDYSIEFADLMRYAKKSIDSFAYGHEGTLRLKLWSGEKEFKVMRECLNGDGYIIRFDGNLFIMLSTELNSRDEKITLAHEAAHLLRVDSSTLRHQNHAVEIGAEKLAREIIMPKWGLAEYKEMEHSMASARKIADENSIPVGSVLARLTYDTNTWDDIGFGIYTTYGSQNSYKSFITSPYPLEDLYYSRNREAGYIGASFEKPNASSFEFPEVIHISAGTGARYELHSGKEVQLKEPVAKLIRKATRNFQTVVSGADQSAVASGIIATAGFEPSRSNARNVKGMPMKTRLGNTLITLSRED